MPRPIRIEYEHAFYHVMNRGKSRQLIYHDRRYYQAFLETLAEAEERFDAVFHAYCLMPNHYHLLIETPSANLGRIMRHINGVYTQRYNRMKKTDGPLFRGRYKAILIDEDAYLLNLSRYIHRNPIESKPPLVSNLGDWPWSSYPVYINKSTAPNWLTCDSINARLNSKDTVSAHLEFIGKGNPHDIAEAYRQKNIPSVWGDLEFKNEVIRQKKISSQVIQQHIMHKPSVENIVKAVADVFKILPLHITAKCMNRRQMNLGRKLAIYTCQRLGNVSLKEIASQFNLKSTGVVSGCIGEMKKRLLDDKNLEAMYEKLRRQLNLIQ